MDKKNEGQSTLTKGQEKRIQKKKELAALKRKKAMTKTIVIVAIVAVIGVIAFFAGRSIYKNATTTKSNSDFSAELTDEGFIDGVKVADMVNTVDTAELKIARADVEFSDEDLEQRIQTVLGSHKELSSDATLTVADGDEVNIDYVGTIDGVEFAGGNTGGQGDRRTIGAGTLIDDFEQQLIGAHPGDKVTVEVTFPETYSNNPALASKDAVFDVTVNGVYVLPEFTDEFVAANLSDYASTADEYRTYLKDTNYQTNLTSYIQKYISDNSTATSYPSSYLKHLKGLFKFSDEAMYTSYNQMSYQSTGNYAFNSFEEFSQMTDSEYEDYLQERAENQAKLDMAYQLIFEKAGLTITDEEYNDYIKDEAEEDVTSFGKPYFMKRIITDKVLDYFRGIVVVE